MFYVESMYDCNTFVRAGRANQTRGNPYDMPERSSTNLNSLITLFVFQVLPWFDTHTIYQHWRIFSF